MSLDGLDGHLQLVTFLFYIKAYTINQPIKKMEKGGQMRNFPENFSAEIKKLLEKKQKQKDTKKGEKTPQILTKSKK